ncbi:MAG: outer membrane lipoprotein-sorting protein [Gemmatimonadota bacterium]
MRSRWQGVVAVAVSLVALDTDPASGWQQDAAVERGREIAVEADRRARGFGDYQAQMDMILIDRRGKETLRELELSVLEVSVDEEKSIVYFQSPRDIRGTGLLTYSYRDRDNEQWLYLPALRRTKRISASGRSSPFMGSEFSYEDLVPAHVNQYEYRFVGEEECEESRCFVVERYPVYDGTGYSRQQMWIDVVEYRVLRIDSWDLRDRPVKTLRLSQYVKYLDRVWQPGEARMVNLLTDGTTVLNWRDYRFGTGLRESDFTRAALARVR